MGAISLTIPPFSLSFIVSYLPFPLYTTHSFVPYGKVNISSLLLSSFKLSATDVTFIVLILGIEFFLEKDRRKFSHKFIINTQHKQRSDRVSKLFLIELNFIILKSHNCLIISFYFNNCAFNKPLHISDQSQSSILQNSKCTFCS